MRVTQTTVRFGITANLGNFNSARVELEMVIDLDGENPTIARAEALELLKTEVFEAIQSVKGPKRKPNGREDLL